MNNEQKISHLNSNLLDFAIGSFPILKKIQCLFAEINTCEIWEITLRSCYFFFQNIS